MYNEAMGTYEVTVEHSFSASHAVRMPDKTWEASHSHVWKVGAAFRADRLDATMYVVIDFVVVQRALQEIASILEGADLNELPAFASTGASAERVADYIAEKLTEHLGRDAGLYRVAVTEAPGCIAAYYPQAPGG
jgi:6-pyruvoyl-tetrahydropterin synthase